MLFVILLLAYYIDLITLNSSNLRFDIFGLSYFEYLEKIIDSADDKNRLIYFIFSLGEFVIAFIYARIINIIFTTIARKKIEKNKE